MGFLSTLFGGGEKEERVAEPVAEPENENTQIDPNTSSGLSQAAKQKQQIMARRGRTDLRTDRGTSSGVAIAGKK